MSRRHRPLLALAAVALVATACAGTPDAAPASSELADGDATVEEVSDEAPAATDEDEADTAMADDQGEVASSEADADDEQAAEADAPADAAAEALWWTAETVDGDTFVAADLAGENVVLWMWAPWCSVCNREAPEVAEALADLPDDVTVIGVAGRDEVGPMRDFIEEHDLAGITHVVDADGEVWASYGISYQPAWVFIDQTGDASVAAGALGYDGIFTGIEQVFRG